VCTVSAFAKIGRDAAAQVFGLAHIEDTAFFVEEAIDARRFGHGIGDAFEIFRFHAAKIVD
jgi:hypothetical protein